MFVCDDVIVLCAGGNVSSVVRHVEVPVIENELCNEMYSKMEEDVTLVISDDMMCAGFDFGGRDACQVTGNCTLLAQYLP